MRATLGQYSRYTLNGKTCGHPANGVFGTVFKSVPHNSELMTPRDNQRSGEERDKIPEDQNRVMVESNRLGRGEEGREPRDERKQCICWNGAERVDMGN